MRTRVHGLRVLVLLLVAGSVLLAAAGVASADSEFGVGDPFGYLAVSGLAAFDDRGDLWLWNWGSADVDGGVTARAGFRIGAPVAIELQGDWVNLKAWRKSDRWTTTANLRIYPSQIDYTEMTGETLFDRMGPGLDSVWGIFPKRLQPYLVAGAGVIGGDPSGDDYQLNGAFRLGAGTDFYVTEQMAVSFGYEWLTGTGYWSKADTRNLTLGIQYNF